jgi:asparagine synthase (glutamine-hydrolysing)
MCGITGFIDYRKSISEEDLLNASAALRHRGGSGNGHIYETHERYNLGLANERLAIIDPSASGAQPFTSVCGNYSITFNGTIYNYLELRATLIKYGVTFKTLTDTEILLECYKKWGHLLFDKIDGSFAFAILDRKQRQLFLARDTMGVKPLYYYKSKDFFAFASELRGILCYPTEKKTNLNALAGYLRQGYFFGSDTIYENIYNFKKQHYFIIDLNSGNYLENKFDNEAPENAHLATEKDILTNLNELITDSILKRNVADVNVGVLLSGGYDSAMVAAILQKNQARRVRTFTLGFSNKKINEATAAKAIANYLKTNHKEYYINNLGATATLEKLPHIFDEPLGDSSAIPLAFLTEQIANEDVKVILGAEGGDELFAGYTNYKKAIWLHNNALLMPNLVKKIMVGLAKRRKDKLHEILFAKNLLGTYEVLTSIFTNNEISLLLNEEVKPLITDQASGQNVKSLLDFDLNNYLPNDLLLKSDRIAMYYGIDNRDALLKPQLVDTIKRIDAKLFLQKGELKYLLKTIAHQYIPEKLMNRPKKGFNIPIIDWMSTIFKPYIEEYLSPQQLDKHRLFNIIEVYKIKNRFYMNPNKNDAKKLWLLLQFQMWYTTHYQKHLKAV